MRGFIPEWVMQMLIVVLALGLPATLSGFLHYTHFDPRPFPNLMARLESQGIERPPPADVGFFCER